MLTACSTTEACLEVGSSMRGGNLCPNLALTHPTMEKGGSLEAPQGVHPHSSGGVWAPCPGSQSAGPCLSVTGRNASEIPFAFTRHFPGTLYIDKAFLYLETIMSDTVYFSCNTFPMKPKWKSLARDYCQTTFVSIDKVLVRKGKLKLHNLSYFPVSGASYLKVQFIVSTSSSAQARCLTHIFLQLFFKMD